MPRLRCRPPRGRRCGRSAWVRCRRSTTQRRPGRVDGAVVGHAEPAIGRGGGGEGSADFGHRGIAALQQHFPLAGGGSEVAAVLGDLDDVAKGVLGARVGGIDGVSLAAGVVGEHDIDLAIGAVGLDVLGAVHPGGAEQIAGAAGLDDHVGLAGKAVLGGERTLAVDERQPFERAVLGEPGHIERALIEQVHVGGTVSGVVGA